MKKTILFIIALIILNSLNLNAQNVGIGTTSPHFSAKLEVASTTSGLLIPRMNEGQRLLISFPSQGLLVYQTNTIPGFYYNKGTPGLPNWKRINDESTGWSVYGNAETDTSQNFIGNIDNVPLNFRVNNQQAGMVSGNDTRNTLWGYSAGLATQNITNATAIGAGAVATSSNMVRIGNTSVTVIEGSVPFSTLSDARFKENVKENVPGLDFIKQLNPVTYFFNQEKLDEYTRTGLIDSTHSIKFASNQMRTGFLAQDVEKLVKKLGYSFDGLHVPVNNKDHYSLAYSQFVMPIVKAIQEQQLMIEDLKKANKELVAKVNQLFLELSKSKVKIKK